MDRMGNLDRACSQDGHQPHHHPLDADAQSDARLGLWLGDRLAGEVGAQALDGLPRLVLWESVHDDRLSVRCGDLVTVSESVVGATALDDNVRQLATSSAFARHPTDREVQAHAL
ncbi:hypothetical protein [Actinomadura geliboluensis]|uniref:hypothetical protein n=1 Tax=Actinomadura geliboluensis TaxID=882440 RepID=UPI00262C2D4C|nr:hypothetical protein [Actinomadura geliboluensis]